MKRYKLIKDYLGCDYKLGTVIDTTFIWVNNKKVFLENYPENWREVVEYPIGTKVHNSQTNTIYTKKKDGWYKPAEKTAYTDEMIGSYKHLTLLGKSEEVVEKDYEILSLVGNSYFGVTNIELDVEDFIKGNPQCKNWNIHSVKRLSDGEVFTVGDEFTSLGLRTYKISKIDFSTHPVYKDVIGLYFDNYQHILLKVAEHVKKPLFTTEDGVDIFKGSKYFTVYTMEDDKGVYETWKTQCHPFSAYGEPEHFIHKDVVYFSTKEAAEEYILMNKPCLSINDITEHFNTHYSKDTFAASKAELVKLVKSKL